MTALRVHAFVWSGTNLIMFPNGHAHQLTVSTDVWMGSGFIEKITLSTNGAVAENVELQVYNGITRATKRPVVGGTGPAPELDRWRVICGAAGAVAVDDYGQVQFSGGAHAQLTDQQRLFGIANRQIAIPILAAGGPQFVDIPVRQHFPGMGIVATKAGAGIVTVAVHYLPKTSGATRKRIFYRLGTVKVQPVGMRDAPL